MKEEPLEDDPLNIEMLVKIKGDPDEPEMAEPSSAATGTCKRNQYTSSACVRRRIRLFSLAFLWDSSELLFSLEQISVRRVEFLIHEYFHIDLSQCNEPSHFPHNGRCPVFPKVSELSTVCFCDACVLALRISNCNVC